MLPEAAAAADHVFPQPRLALVHARRCSVAERGAVEPGGDALLVKRMAGLVDGREQRLADIVRIDPRGDAHVAGGKAGRERMMGLVQPAAFEVVADLADHGAAECELRRLVERPVQGVVVGRGLRRDRVHDRHQLAAQLGEQGADRCGGHAFVGAVDQGIGDVRIGREEAGIFAGKLDGPFQERRHGREIIGRPRPRPGVVGRRAGRTGARDVVGRHLDRLFEVAFRHPDQACGVGLIGQRSAIRDRGNR